MAAPFVAGSGHGPVRRFLIRRRRQGRLWCRRLLPVLPGVPEDIPGMLWVTVMDHDKIDLVRWQAPA
jgi:hypothetical protein